MEQWETYNRIKTAEAKSDLIGAILHSELYERLELHQIVPARENEAWNKFSSNLEKIAGEKYEDISERIMDYGNEREETGFRMGFHVAMRLCMQGLNGGAAAL